MAATPWALATARVRGGVCFACVGLRRWHLHTGKKCPSPAPATVFYCLVACRVQPCDEFGHGLQGLGRPDEEDRLLLRSAHFVRGMPSLVPASSRAWHCSGSQAQVAPNAQHPVLAARASLHRQQRNRRAETRTCTINSLPLARPGTGICVPAEATPAAVPFFSRRCSIRRSVLAVLAPPTSSVPPAALINVKTIRTACARTNYSRRGALVVPLMKFHDCSCGKSARAAAAAPGHPSKSHRTIQACV